MEPEATYQIQHFNLEETEHWKQELQKSGVVVIKNVLSNEQVQKSITLFWEWLEALDIGVKRGEPLTWDLWPGMRKLGFFATYGGCHTQASWFIRCHPRVQEAFAQIWNTNNLISSFDTFIGWKPWWINKQWTPYVENLHVDQNPSFKKGLKCVQGMIPLKRVRKDEVGGLMVVPNTNNDDCQKQLVLRYPGTKGSRNDWLQLKSSDPFVKDQKGVLVECDAGDLILWDSRTVHGGKVCQPSEEFKEKNNMDFVRLAMTVTMVPREWASKQVLAQRKNAFKNKIGLTHWPNQFHKSGMGEFLPNVETNKINYQWVKLEGDVEKLV